jgi:hypothetical protein
MSDSGGMSLLHSACSWIMNAENTALWEAWLPRAIDSKLRCSVAEISAIDREHSSLSTCNTIREMIAKTSAACRRCILATVASVFGVQFASERLHLLVDEPPAAFVCIPSLASRLATDQALQFMQATQRQEPFALSVSLSRSPSEPSGPASLLGFSTDLFMPSSETAFGRAVYLCLDTRYRLVACNPSQSRDTWVMSSASNPYSSETCAGEFRIDLSSGKFRALDGKFDLIMTPHFDFGSCAAVLQSVHPGELIATGALVFPATATAQDVSCLLSRLFGPQSAYTGLPASIELHRGLGAIQLVTDLVVRAGALTVIGNGNSIILGSHQVLVRPTARLTLEFIALSSSLTSSAIRIQGGHVVLHNSTVHDCHARMNAVNPAGLLMSHGAGLYVGHAGLLEMYFVELRGNVVSDGEIESAGGAVYASGNSTVKLAGSKVHGNRAEKAGLTSKDFSGVAQGGAFAVLGSSSLSVDQSDLFNNIANESGFWSQGGAICCLHGSTLSVSRSTLRRNSADLGGLLFNPSDMQDAGSYGGAIDAEYGVTANISDSELSENLSDRGVGQWSASGAINAFEDVTLVIVRSRLMRNVARGGSDGSFAGAVSIESGSSAFVIESQLCENGAVDGVSRSFGGAIKVVGAMLKVVRSRLCGNLARAGLSAEGGALYLESGAFAEFDESDLSSNQAIQGGVVSRGGAASLSPPYSLQLRRTLLLNNKVLCELDSFGGAIFAKDGDGSILISSCTLEQNLAFSSAAQSEAGALHIGTRCLALIYDTQISSNRAIGRMASGGGLFSSGRTSLRNVSMLGNQAFANGTEGQALGGAVFQASGSFDAVDCWIAQNSVEIHAPAVRGTGGGIVVDTRAAADFERVTFVSNTVRGPGWYDQPVPAYLLATSGEGLEQFEAERNRLEMSKGSHVYSLGVVKLHYCNIEKADGPLDARDISYSAQWLIVAGGGRIVLDYSRFDAHADDHIGLLNAFEQTESLISGCTVTNLNVRSLGLLGVVNSSFEPPLNATTAPTVTPPNCDTYVAGEAVCDPRARCESRPNGGVQCECSGNGLTPKPGSAPDGRHCTLTELRAVLQSQSVSIAVTKPGTLANLDLSLIVEAKGESDFAVEFGVSMSLFDAVSKVEIGVNRSVCIDQPLVSAFGQHIQWKRQDRPPEATWLAKLDASKGRYTDIRTHDFTVRLQCTSGQQSCAADGDLITTVIQLRSPENKMTANEVRFQTLVQALPGCNHSSAIIMQSGGSSKLGMPVGTDSLLTDTALVFVDLRIADTDGIPIRVSLPNAVVSWGIGKGHVDRIVPTRSAEGGSQSNLFTASIGTTLRRTPGLYRLQVVLLDAWNETLGAVGECVLLEQVVHVKEPAGLTTAWLAVGSLSLCVVLLGAIGVCIRRKSVELRNILIMVISEASKTIVLITFKLGNLATDILTTYHVVFEGIVKSPHYRVPYAIFGSLSIVVNLISIAYLVRRGCQLRLQIKRNAEIHPEISGAGRGALLHNLGWELEKSSRDLEGLTVGVLVLLLEELPMVRAHRPTPSRQ